MQCYLTHIKPRRIIRDISDNHTLQNLSGSINIMVIELLHSGQNEVFDLSLHQRLRMSDQGKGH